MEVSRAVIQQVEAKVGEPIVFQKALGGLTNTNYLLSFKSGSSYVLKVFNQKVSQQNDRVNEKKNQHLAWTIGLAPKMELLNEAMGLIEYVPTSKELQVNKETVTLCAFKLAMLHNSKLPFCGNFDFVNVGQKCLEVCQREKIVTSSEVKFVVDALCTFKKVVAKLPIPCRVPCHNDLHLSNFVASDKGLMLIDWEDAAMNDPAWDIAGFLLASRIPEGLWPAFFSSYCGRIDHQDPLLIQRVKVYRPYVLLKFALSLKAALEKTVQEQVEVQQLISLCMNNAETILNAKGYQEFVQGVISKSD